MGVADKLNARLHAELKAYVAWFPVTNRIAVGDYGLIAHGVFQPMGNIAEFGVVIPPPIDSPAASINFSSDGTSVTRAVAGASVDAFPDEPIDAKLSVEFSDAESYLVKAATVATQEMANVAAVASHLCIGDGLAAIVQGRVGNSHRTELHDRDFAQGWREAGPERQGKCAAAT